MRVIFLGSIQQSPDMVQLIESSLSVIKSELPDDLIFFYQTSLDSKNGIEYDRHSNFIEFIIDKTNPPTSDAVLAVVQEALEKQNNSRPEPPFF